MSKHWKPDEKPVRVAAAQPRTRWPDGATAGLVVLGAACVGTVLVLYRLAGPRDIFGS